MSCRVTAVRGLDGRPVGEIPASAGGRNASRALQAGLVAIAAVGTLFATLGTWFSRNLAYLLLAVAGLSALFGIRWADRASHVPPDRTARGARRDAHIGAALSAAALLVVLYFTGLWLVALFVWPVVLSVGLIAWAVHRERVAVARANEEAEP